MQCMPLLDGRWSVCHQGLAASCPPGCVTHQGRMMFMLHTCRTKRHCLAIFGGKGPQDICCLLTAQTANVEVHSYHPPMQQDPALCLAC